MKAVILAGGLGTRLQPYTFFIPKPMLPLGNKPLLEHIIDWVTSGSTHGNNNSNSNHRGKIDHIILCVSYLHRAIEDYFEDGRRFGIKIDYARSDRPLATAGQLKTAEKFLDETFVCVYGDAVYAFELDKMIREHKDSKAFISMALLSYKTNLRYGFIDINDGIEGTGEKQGEKQRNRVISWREKPEVRGLINIGCYVMEPGFLKLVPKSSAFGMDDAVRKALEQNRLVNGFKIDSGFIDIGDKKSYLEAYKKYVKKLGKI
ncbi:MAG TPA: nucleotidyltransferase family protein [Candidatus Nitrosopolaris sp.]|nr:nucleotidyltransferase family protein [Candidatus Nitrosopolaris sp.]